MRVCAHHVADVDPDTGEEGAEDVVADGRHKGQVLVGGQEGAQHQHLHSHQAVQAGHHCRQHYCLRREPQPCATIASTSAHKDPDLRNEALRRQQTDAFAAQSHQDSPKAFYQVRSASTQVVHPSECIKYCHHVLNLHRHLEFWQMSKNSHQQQGAWRALGVKFWRAPIMLYRMRMRTALLSTVTKALTAMMET